MAKEDEGFSLNNSSNTLEGPPSFFHIKKMKTSKIAMIFKNRNLPAKLRVTLISLFGPFLSHIMLRPTNDGRCIGLWILWLVIASTLEFGKFRLIAEASNSLVDECEASLLIVSPICPTNSSEISSATRQNIFKAIDLYEKKTKQKTILMQIPRALFVIYGVRAFLHQSTSF